MILQNLRIFFSSGEWYVTLILIVGSLLLAFLLRILSMFLIKNLSKISGNTRFYEHALRFRGSGTLLLMLLILFLVSPFLKFPAYLQNLVRHIWMILLIIDISWILIKVVRTIKILLLQKIDLQAKNNLRARKIYTQFRILEQIIIAIIIIIALAISLMTFDKVKEIGVSLLASAGVAGIVIGFAAQKSLASVIAGLQIAITQPIRIDDVVVVEGEWGRIEEITLTYVVVNIWDKRRLVLPISYFVENHFQNWTRSSSEILGTVYIYVDYKFPVGAMRKELDKILKDTDLWDGKVNVVQVTGTNEKTMELRALISADDSSNAWDLRVHVREKLVEFLQKKYPEYLPHSRILIDSA